LSQTVSLADIYEEIKKVNTRLESIERILEVIVERSLPEEEISEEELKEIREIEKEIERDEYVTLDEMKKKYGFK